jgi:hypothetical protein
VVRRILNGKNLLRRKKSWLMVMKPKIRLKADPERGRETKGQRMEVDSVDPVDTEDTVDTVDLDIIQQWAAGDSFFPVEKIRSL